MHTVHQLIADHAVTLARLMKATGEKPRDELELTLAATAEYASLEALVSYVPNSVDENHAKAGYLLFRMSIGPALDARLVGILMKALTLTPTSSAN